MVTLTSGESAIRSGYRLLARHALRKLAQLADHLRIRERLGFVAQRGRGGLHLGADVLGQLGDRGARIAPLGMLLVQRQTLLFAQLRHRIGPLDPRAELFETAIEEDERWNGLVLAILEVLVHDLAARLLVAQ